MLLNVFGDIESFVSELYPYRFVITPLLLAAAVGVLFLAYRAGTHRILLRHRVATAAIGVPLVVVSLFAGNYLLSPLWERSFLEEASPLDAVAPAASPTPGSSGDGDMVPVSMDQPTGPVLTLAGMFEGADSFHFGRGDAQIIETQDGKAILRFENFSVRNGPDLYVYLSMEVDGARVDEALNLGRLKATDGAFNYEIPDNVDIDSIRSVLVWCRQFSTLFAVAELAEV